MRRSLTDADDLIWMTRRVLHAFAAETRWRGHAVGRVVYAAGDAEWSFPLAFDEFLAVGHALLSAELRQRTWANRAMGVSIALLSLELALVARERPALLTARRRDWDDTLFAFLKSRGPRVVVIVDLFVVWPSGIDGWPVEPPAIVAIGLHPTRIVGLVCAQRAGEPGGMSFGPPIALGARLAHALGEDRYLRVFGPERT